MSNTLKFGNGEWYGKEGTILAYNSENNNYKPLPFTFDRASSATRVNKDGLIETVGADQPRVDYLNDSKGALLLEPSRTNSLLQSNQFDTTWSSTNATLTSGQIGVGGSTDAWKLSSIGSSSRLSQTISTSGQKSYTIYAKKGSLNFIRVFARDTGDSNPSVYFNLSNGTVASEFEVDDATIKDVGNSWYRCEIVFTKTISDVRIYPAIADGDLSQTSGDIYIQYSQLESASYATSYIPTSGSAVTRLADAMIGNLPSSSIGQSEGVLYFEGSYLDTSENGYIELSDGGNANRIIVWNVSSTSLRAFIEVGNVTQAQISGGSISSNTIFKFAFKYKTNDFAFWVNGVKIGVDTNGSTFGSNVLNQLDLQIPSVEFKGEVKELKLYNTALSDSELQALTT